MGKTIDIGRGNDTPEQQPQQPKFNIADSVEMKCDECDSTVFISAVKFRKISKLLAGTPQDVIIPLEIYVCGSCGAINTALYMETLKQIGINETNIST